VKLYRAKQSLAIECHTIKLPQFRDCMTYSAFRDIYDPVRFTYRPKSLKSANSITCQNITHFSHSLNTSVDAATEEGRLKDCLARVLYGSPDDYTTTQILVSCVP